MGQLELEVKKHKTKGTTKRTSKGERFRKARDGNHSSSSMSQISVDKRVIFYNPKKPEYQNRVGSKRLIIPEQ